MKIKKWVNYIVQERKMIKILSLNKKQIMMFDQFHKQQFNLIIKSFLIQIAEQKMIRKTQQLLFKQILIMSKQCFWKKSKTQLEKLQYELQTKDNLGHLVKSILQKNKSSQKLLPPKKDDGKLTVVMEMDEFLIYSFTPDEEGYLLAPMRPYDFYEQMDQFNALLSIYKRKNLNNFLNYLKQQCEPVLWTTAVPEYTEVIMKLIDPERKIKHVFTQEHCDRIIVDNQQIDQYVKDLNLLDRDLSRIVYLDSRPLSFWLHPDNAFPQDAFRADNTMLKQDLDLVLLDLQDLRKRTDVRTYLRERYAIESHLKECKLL